MIEIKTIDLPGLLRNLGFEILKEGKSYRLKNQKSFTLFKNKNNFWNYKDFSSGKSGDVLDCLEVLGYDKKSAFNILDVKKEYKPCEKKSIECKQSVPKNIESDKFVKILEYGKKALFETEGRACIEWLQNERGIKIDTAKKFQLGYNSKHDNLIIPCFLDNHLVRLRFRNCATGAKMLYTGSDGKAFFNTDNLTTDNAVIVVESELDAILLAQDTDYNAIASGTALNMPDKSLLGELLKCNALLVCIDNDKAGEACMAKWLAKTDKAFCFTALKGKDIGECKDVNLQEYIDRAFLFSHGLNTLEVFELWQERAAIMQYYNKNVSKKQADIMAVQNFKRRF